MTTLQGSIHDSMQALPDGVWSLPGASHVFMSQGWLQSLEATGCAVSHTGWQPVPLTLEEGGQVVGCVPAYLKHHSRGEYVFDWAWAEAYQHAGLDYYPKLLVASPFTPVTGPRLLAGAEYYPALITALEQVVHTHELSSAHVLFPTPPEQAALEQAGWLMRHGVQFHWHNQGYADFEAFLATLSRDKRKKIRQERRKVQDVGVTVETRVGVQISDDDWEWFERCYRQTYHEHRSSPYLNLAFFRTLGQKLPEACVMFVAWLNGQRVAASLCIKQGDVLYGRYWGAVVDIPCLHFELCYYQGLEFAISQQLALFEGGAQGEHKLARGFEPVSTASAHYIRDPRFKAAIARWLEHEKAGVAEYQDELFLHSAYKNTCVP